MREITGDKTDKTVKVISFRDFSRADDVAILDYLECHLSSVTSDVEGCWTQFCNAVKFCIDKFVPLKKVVKRSENPWINREIIHVKRKLKRLRKQHRTGTPLFGSLKSKMADKVREARNSFFKNRLEEFMRSDPSKFWRHLNPSRHEITKIKIDEVTITDANEIATHFNNYFQSVFTKLDDFKPQCVCSNDYSSVCSNELIISREGVLAMLLKLNTKKSSGPDGVPNSFLKRYAEQISQYLTDMFNLSLTTGVIPSDWRKARVVPILKKGDCQLVTNYRPVSLTNNCCKLLEHAIFCYIVKFLEDRNILTAYQHGFRRGMSTVTQLLSVVHEFSRVLDASGQTDVLFFDFSKAFDKVPHGKLLFKLESIGLPSFIIQWVHAYLTDRQQFVAIQDSCSDMLHVTSGVPQGSVLGPLLFLIYVNDLVDIVEKDVEVRLFADDCIVFKEVVGDSDHLSLQKTVLAIADWCERWGMDINPNKTVLLRITRKKVPRFHSYILHNHPILEVESYKYLGVTLTNKLTWSTHIADICSSAVKKLWFIKRKLRNSPVSTRITAYKACVRSRLEYAAAVWDPHNKKDIAQLERVQRKAVRFIYGKYRRIDSPTALIRKSNLQFLAIRRKVTRLVLLHNYMSGNLKADLPDCVKLASTRRTRHVHEQSLAPIFARLVGLRTVFFRTLSRSGMAFLRVYVSLGILRRSSRTYCMAPSILFDDSGFVSCLLTRGFVAGALLEIFLVVCPSCLGQLWLAVY